MKRLFFYLTAIVILMIASFSAFAHAGSHDNQNCFIHIATTTVRFSGYQFQGQHPEHTYCSIFPDLGQTVIKIESVSEDLSDQKVTLELVKLESWLAWISGFDRAFSSVKKIPLQRFKHNVVMINTDIQKRGVYALKLELVSDNKVTPPKHYLFLVGIPITQLLVLFSFFALAFIMAIYLTSHLKKQRKPL